VTGFGLCGHLIEVARASGLGFRLHAGRVPLLDGALELASRDIVPAGSRNNLSGALAAGIAFAEEIAEPMQLVLCDAQTSGGLLIAVAPEQAQELVHALTRAAVAVASVVGELTKDQSFRVL
ncbi:MAG TPA: AIR synthase-related protein, partial [Candidatus Eremiobacteraceae bacterium]|nr:AIR synthase-related protein [Candidatus Eremiobacteraceae bacterium]